MNYKSILIGSAVAFAIVAGGLYAWDHRDRSDLRVQTAEVTLGPVVRRVVVTGTLEAVKSVDIGSQVSGQIKSLEADFNSIVKKGQVIAHIDPVAFQAALDNAQANYEKSVADLGVAEASLEDANQKLTRAKNLAEKQLIAQSDLDAAVIVQKSAATSVGSARALVTRAKGLVDQARANLDHTIITSPVDGIVVNRAVDVGQTVAASYQAPVLFTIAANIDQMQVEAQVDEADVGAVREGQEVTFQVESYPTETFHGTISQVRLQPTSPTTTGSAQTGTNALTGATFRTATNGISYTTIIAVDNADRRLRPGMTATAVLVGSSRENVTRIPNTALLFRPSIDLLKAVGQGGMSNARSVSTEEDSEEMQQVWTFDGKHFVPVAVELGLSDSQWVEEVRGPLKPGDRVVTNAAYGPEPKAQPAPSVPSPFSPGGRRRR
jgi:HlyD family secretion protein